MRLITSHSLPALIAVVAAGGVLCGLDAGGDYPALGEGPGVTIDETFNVQQGVRLVVGGKAWLAGAITWRDLFGDERDLGPNPPLAYHLPDHPPLGRWWLGLCHEAFVGLFPPRDHDGFFVTTAARSGSAFAFGATVFLVGWWTARWHGTAAGAIAAASLALMPRVFGHAHIAALETCIGLAYAACVLFLADRWSGEPPGWRGAMLAGLFFGLALLTKIQGALLPLPVGLWALWRWRGRAIVPCLVWGLTGLAVLFAGWPWLWLHPWDHLLEYLGRTTNRTAINVWYFGRHYADRDVPWHYPWVLFATTVPIGLQLLGVFGLRRRGRSPRDGLILGSLLAPLIVFSLPGIAVYDGERLFLVSFPPWAVFIGRGGAAAIGRIGEWLPRASEARRRLAGALAVSLFLVAQSYGVFALRPCWLSYYNAAVGGLRGAEPLGLELDYWGCGVTRSLLAEGTSQWPDGAHLATSPVLHQFQLGELRSQSPVLRRRNIELTPAENEVSATWLLAFRRQAERPAPWFDAAEWEAIAEVRREGVPLAGLYRASPE